VRRDVESLTSAGDPSSSGSNHSDSGEDTAAVPIVSTDRPHIPDDEFEALFGDGTAEATGPEQHLDTPAEHAAYPKAHHNGLPEPAPVPAPPARVPGRLEGDILVLNEPPAPPGSTRRKMSTLERRRRVKLQARRVRRIIRHVEPWSVLKMSIIFYACLWVVLLIAGVVVWTLAEEADVITKFEDQVKEYFVLDTFELDAREIFRGYAYGGLAFAIAGTAFNVLMCLLFNLISDLIGGLRVTMIEEETARPRPGRRVRRAPRRR
jgi:hypothetical protein